MNRVNSCVAMNSEAQEISESSSKKAEIAQDSSAKRAGDKLEFDKSKKQKTDEHEEVEVDDEAELKKHMETVKDDDIAIDVIPLVTKPLVIVEYKLIREGIMGHYQMIRADGSFKRYSSMTRMLQGIDREDLQTIWKLVKTKHGDTRLEDEHERVLWGDLKVMFEPDIKSDVWRNLQGYKVTGCKLFDSCGVHFVSTAGTKVYAAGFQLLEELLLSIHWDQHITFVDSIYEAEFATDSSSLTKPIQKTQVVLVDIPKNFAENDNIVAKHGLSSKITQSPGWSSDTSEGSENSRSFEDIGRSNEEDSKDRASSKEGGSETSQVRRSSRESKAPVSWERRKPSVQVEEKSVRIKASTEIMVDDMLVAGSDMAEFNKPKWQFPLVFEMKDRCFEKQVLGYVLTVHVTTVEWESRLQKSITIDVHQVGDEREVEVLRSFNWPPSELITEDGVLPERVQRVPYVRRYRKCVLYVRRYRKVRAVALLKGRWFEVYRDYLRWRTVK
ncbi:hypothetical protein Tco_0273540 [Tanacetum coccineum]